MELISLNKFTFFTYALVISFVFIQKLFPSLVPGRGPGLKVRWGEKERVEEEEEKGEEEETTLCC